MIAPEQQVWIGKLIMWGSLAGLVLLGIHHVSSAVAGPASAKVKPRMEGSDVVFYGGGAAALAAVAAAFLRYKAVAAILAIIACLAVIVDAADRRGFLEIGTVPAYMRLLPIEIGEHPGGGVSFNAFAINDGSVPAIGPHWETKAVTSDNGLSNAEIDAHFDFLKKLAKPWDEKNFDSEVQPGDINWVTMDETLTKDQYSKVTKGPKTLYFFVLIRYRDRTLSKGEWVSTEGCSYTLKGDAQHLCEHHNRVYVRD